jgi:hypothetical protein
MDQIDVDEASKRRERGIEATWMKHRTDRAIPEDPCGVFLAFRVSSKTRGLREVRIGTG